jgi:hypothetical protein
MSGTLELPCQKSPSQKIAILSLLSTKSGLPLRPAGWHSKRRPRPSSIPAITASGAVFSLLILDMMRLRVSGETVSVIALHCLYCLYGL